MVPYRLTVVPHVSRVNQHAASHTMSAMSAPKSAPKSQTSGLTGDARTDRWAAHRAAVRTELLDSTLLAIEQHGPDVAMDDIAKFAGVPKPKLYRYFSDKGELFEAVADRVNNLLLERIAPHFALSGTPEQAVRAALTSYVDLVDEHPNLFRFLVNSHFIDGQAAMEKIRSGGMALAATGSSLMSMILKSRGADDSGVDIIVDALLGSVGLGVLRWLNYPTISKDELVEQMFVIVWGACSAVLESRGVSLRE